MCGAAASGNYHWMYNPFNPADRDIMLGIQDAARGLLTMILAGPFMEGYSQTINDWYDRDIDAINEPYRPIPSGAISELQVMQQIYFLITGSLCIGLGIDVWAGHNFPAVLLCALIGTLAGYIYSAPPLRLKQNGWSGDVAIGLCYVTLPWWCGHAAFGELDRMEYWVLPLVYSLSGIGPAIANGA
jgi:chlorophyll synthase